MLLEENPKRGLLSAFLDTSLACTGLMVAVGMKARDDAGDGVDVYPGPDNSVQETWGCVIDEAPVTGSVLCGPVSYCALEPGSVCFTLLSCPY